MITKYYKIRDVEIPDQYECTDEGIFYCKKGKGGSVEKQYIAEPLTIIGMYNDVVDNKEYTVFEYYDLHSKTPKQIAISSLNVKKGILDELLEGSYEVASLDGLKRFIRETKLYNKTQILNGIPTIMNFGMASTKYGFSKFKNRYDYDKFVGLDTAILSTDRDHETDDPIFDKSGSLEAWKVEMNSISFDAPSNCRSIFRLAIASGLASITLAFLPENYYPPVISFSGPSSIGKGLILSCICSLFGHPTSPGGIKTTSDSSPAGMYALKNRLNQLPLCIEDIQDIFQDKNRGIDYISQMIFNHSKGVGSLRATIDGKKRNTITFRNAMILFAETADLDKLNGGAKARVIDFKIDRMDGERITNKPTNLYKINSYGHAGAEYIHKIVEYNKTHNIVEEFNEEVNKYTMKEGVNVKHAATYALLSYSFNLAVKFKILDFWENMNEDECLSQYNFDDGISADQKLYEAICNYIVRHNNVYPFTKEKIMRKDYEIRLGTVDEIRGRLDKDENCCWIPTDTLNQVMDQCIKTYAINGITANIKVLSSKWVKCGYLERYNKEKIQWTKTNITSPTCEKVYKLKMLEHCLDNLNIDRKSTNNNTFNTIN